jgi:hypothetical protein
MKKVILCMAVLAMGALKVSAQKESAEVGSFKFGIGLNAGLPVGDIKPFSSFAVGGDLQGEYTVAESLGLTASAGYLTYTGKDGNGSTPFVPILVGGKYHFSEKVFGHAQLGVSISTEKGVGSFFTYAPSIGYDVSDNFSVALKYQAASKNSFSASFLGLRAAYSF